MLDELLKYLAATGGIGGIVAALAAWFAIRKDRTNEETRNRHETAMHNVRDAADKAQREMAEKFASTVQTVVTTMEARHTEQIAELTGQFVDLIKDANQENRILAEQIHAVADVLSRKNARG